MIQQLRDIHPSVLTIAMDREEKRNALDAAMAASLTEAIEDAASDDSVRAIVLTGREKSFSAGADLAALQRLSSASFQENLRDSRTLANLFEAVYNLDKPVVARVNGHAIAGGCGLAAVCDFVVADPRAKLGFTEVRIGFVPAIISVYLLERFPEYAIRRVFLNGGLFSAEEGLRLGLVSEVAEEGALDEAVSHLMQSLVRDTSSQAVVATKQLLRRRFEGTHVDALESAVKLNARARGETDCMAGVNAFLTKTPFPWTAEWDSAR